VLQAVEAEVENLVDGQLLYSGAPSIRCDRDGCEAMKELDKAVDVVFCPERIAEGYALRELSSLPQIVSGRDPGPWKRAGALFPAAHPGDRGTDPRGAELAKLYTNAWRYIKFAAANQFFMIANDFGLDFERIRHAVTYDYRERPTCPGRASPRPVSSRTPCRSRVQRKPLHPRAR